MTRTFDALFVADPRFSGGSTSALAADVTAMSGLGLKIGLFFVRSAYLDDARDSPNPKATSLADLNGVSLLSGNAPARAELAFLHHPLVFFRGIEQRLCLTAGRAVFVTHHAPFRADGSLEWNPVTTMRRARSQTGLNAWYAPISGIVRAQLASFAPAVRQTSIDWPNIFDEQDWPSTVEILTGPRLTIGRHGRSDPLKFPAIGAEIDASLPASERLRVRVMGCPADALRRLGAHPDRWEVLPFGAEPVASFLNSLDVFVYHYHPNWLESFGRTVAEAIFCGRPCVLDPRLRPNFGDLAQYCSAAEVEHAVMRIAADPAASRRRADKCRAQAIAEYGASHVSRRLDALSQDEGDITRGLASVGALTTLRKVAGLRRRQARGFDG